MQPTQTRLREFGRHTFNTGAKRSKLRLYLDPVKKVYTVKQFSPKVGQCVFTCPSANLLDKPEVEDFHLLEKKVALFNPMCAGIGLLPACLSLLTTITESKLASIKPWMHAGAGVRPARPRKDCPEMPALQWYSARKQWVAIKDGFLRHRDHRCNLPPIHLQGACSPRYNSHCCRLELICAVHANGMRGLILGINHYPACIVR